MTRLRVSVVAALVGAGLAGAAAAEPLVGCLLDDDAPRSVRSSEEGFDLDVFREIARRLERTPRVEWRPSESAFAEIEETDLPTAALAAKRCDVAFSIPGSTGLGDDRDELALSVPYYGAAFELVGGAPDTETISDLGSQRVAVRLQSLAHFGLQATKIAWSARPTVEGVLAAVDEGVTQAALVWGPASAGTGHETRTNFRPPRALRFNEHVAVRADDPLLQDVNRVLEELLAEGWIQERLRRHGIPERLPFESVATTADIVAISRSSPQALATD